MRVHCSVIFFLESMLLCCLLFLFFFQAEDGIRDLVRSRGLGDVYKRQLLLNERREGGGIAERAHVQSAERDAALKRQVEIPVSYTHLTLPTSDLV